MAFAGWGAARLPLCSRQGGDDLRRGRIRLMLRTACWLDPKRVFVVTLQRSGSLLALATSYTAAWSLRRPDLHRQVEHSFQDAPPTAYRSSDPSGQPVAAHAPTRGFPPQSLAHAQQQTISEILAEPLHNDDDAPTHASSNARCRSGPSNAPNTATGPNPPNHPTRRSPPTPLKINGIGIRRPTASSPSAPTAVPSSSSREHAHARQPTWVSPRS